MRYHSLGSTCPPKRSFNSMSSRALPKNLCSSASSGAGVVRTSYPGLSPAAPALLQREREEQDSLLSDVLRHVERTRMLLHLVAPSAESLRRQPAPIGGLGGRLGGRL